MAQTFTDWQLLLVDDDSKDESLQVMKEYAVKDSRIKVYHKKNEGVSIARQYGMDRVDTPYFIYCDADDYVEPDYLEKLYEAIEQNHSDIAICAYKEEYEDYAVLSELPETDYDDFVHNLLRLKIWGVTWNKLYKMSIARKNNVHFPAGLQMWEDLTFTIEYCMFAKSVAFVQKPLYHYVKYNGNSITSHEQISYSQNRVVSVQQIEKTIINSGCYEQFKDDLLWLKFHIKDHFLSSKVDKQRINAWYTSFPEVNGKLNKVDNHYLFHMLMVSHMAFLLYLPYYYRQLRFYTHKLIKKMMLKKIKP